MKYNKKSAFTMSEVMVLLLTLSVLMAAFAPAITKRQTAVSFDDVWTYVSTDDNNDAYFDAINRVSTSQAFIGITPEQGSDVPSATSSGSNETLYSKLVIRPSHQVKNTGKQMQMQFRYGDTNNGTGTRVGGIFADGSNFLVGGIYGSISGNYDNSGNISSSGASANTSIGASTLNALTSGVGNTAVGTGALQKLTTSDYNTAVGYRAGYSITAGSYNTLIGYSVLNTKSASGSHNTFVGANVASDTNKSFTGSYNTAFGGNSMYHISSGSYNTAVGYSSLASITSGSNNTAIGYNALNSPTSGSNNTAIGYNAGSPAGLTVGSNKTFIGYFSGSNAEKDTNHNVLSKLFTDDHERVFIGALPREAVTDGDSNAIKKRPGAVLEVHNINVKSSSSGSSVYTSGSQYPIQKVGYSSVVVNGNLIVRGQPYFETPLWRPYSISQMSTGKNPPFPSFKTSEIPKGLVAYRLYDAVKDKKAGLVFKVLNGYDGAMRTAASYQSCNRRRDKYNRHNFKDIRENCICTASNSSYKTYNTAYKPANNGVSTSYDWTSKSSGDVARTGAYSKYNPMGASYTDQDVGGTVTMERNPSFRHERMDVGTDHDNGSLSTDFPLAHPKTKVGSSYVLNDKMGFTSCCPDLKSDARLKNIGEKFTAGLDELKKLNVYNFTFKDDPSNAPHVGVMAQNLKLVFPNAVSKNENGYYQIRWDEMLYAVINSVKSLNLRIENLAHKVADDTNRLVLLKKQNVQLNAKLDELEAEIAQIETKK